MIKFYNRKTKDYEVEKVAGDNYIRWTYENPVGKSFLNLFLKRKLFSKLYGVFCDSNLSKNKVDKFIDGFDINKDEMIDSPDDFKSFNDFFIRKLKPAARPYSNEAKDFISPADGRLLAYENIDIEKLVQVKGFTYSLKELLNDNDLSEKYSGGCCLIFRLCPVDYHRFHFVDNGTISETKKISGEYFSVNPIALNSVPNLYCRNKREFSILKSENFKDVCYVEVGASCVGTIVQTYAPNSKVSRADEKGYFKFGGSTVILFLEKDAVQIDDDIISQSKLGFETKVSMGETIGVSPI